MKQRYPQNRLLIFTKAPWPGEVKTRLLPYLDEEAAARLQQQLIERTLAMACGAELAPVELWLAGDPRHPWLRALVERYGLTAKPQQGADLGERMLGAAREALKDARAVVIIGTDSPAMDGAYLQQAFDALKTHDVVFGPAEDGGYTLIGLRSAWPELFAGVDWGSGAVLRQSLEKAEALGLKVLCLEMGWDLDRPEDYRRALAGGWIREGKKETGR